MLLATDNELDLKAAMSAACTLKNDTVTRLLVEAGAMKEELHPISGKPSQHDWRGDYVAEAVKTDNPLVLQLLFDAGYQITWNNAQVKYACCYC